MGIPTYGEDKNPSRAWFHSAIATSDVAPQAFGEAKTSNADLAKRFGVSATPTLLAVCNGDEAAVERYEGEFKAGPIGAWLERFAGGK